MADQKMLSVQVVSRTDVLWDGKAAMVSVPSVDGQLGILPGRQPVIAALGRGTMTIKGSDDQSHEVQVSGGFVSLDSDHVTVVMDNDTMDA
ncbi:F0F1 ATP synthase subunit epsilon [Gleimia hominis]|uniref:F0F1 ATP synthase subunit epsilon n=1 Tax=Gleimia hominis TaxID=595468 RepID=UPI000C80DCB2|nr:F0F1 ATP synthase subunit epsilon [Gleimia hominis]WIK64832.1 F0F1 ATP synthase subunit epsilon [Gleimia hominis]